MAATGIRRRWNQAGLVGSSGTGGPLHLIVDFEDNPLGAVLAVLLLVLAANAGEGIQDGGDCVTRGGKVVIEVRELLGRLVAGAAVGPAGRTPVAVRVRWQVQVEEGAVHLAANQEAALLVPAERRAIPAAVAGEVTKILSRIEEVRAPAAP